MSEGTLLYRGVDDTDATGAPVVIERRFGVDKPEAMRAWLAEREREVMTHQEFGHKFGGLGGKATWANMTPAQRREKVAKLQEGRLRARYTRLAASGHQLPGDTVEMAWRGRLLTPKQVAPILGVSQWCVIRLCQQGKIRSLNTSKGSIRRRFQIPASEVLSFLSTGHADLGSRLKNKLAGASRKRWMIQVRLFDGQKYQGSKHIGISVDQTKGHPETPEGLAGAITTFLTSGGNGR
jgi:hypothetical protein